MSRNKREGNDKIEERGRKLKVLPTITIYFMWLVYLPSRLTLKN